MTRAGLKIHLVSRDNGVGLSADMELLEGVLATRGHLVQRVEWNRHSMPRCDVAIFLELWSPTLARYARKTVGVFNLEWFQDQWKRHLWSIDQLWAKSLEAHRAYEVLGLRNMTYTGFASRDLMDATVPREVRALHLRGKSDFKGTKHVLDAWRKYPDLPPLTIVSATKFPVPRNVTIVGRLSDAELRHELNRHAIHVCPSKSEGWGHYITEGLSTGAAVVTTNASPMNEHVSPAWGMLVDPIRMNPRGMVREYHVDGRSLAKAVRLAARWDPEHRAEMAKAARAHFEARNATFARTALDLLERI